MDQSTDEKQKVFEIPHTIKLQFPIVVNENKNMESITFTRRLNGQDMSGIPAGDQSKMPIGEMFYPIIAAMTGFPIALVPKLDWQTDMADCIEVVSSFLGPIPKTTESVGDS